MLGNYINIFNTAESSVFENVLCLKNSADKEAPIWLVSGMCVLRLFLIHYHCVCYTLSKLAKYSYPQNNLIKLHTFPHLLHHRATDKCYTKYRFKCCLK